MIQKNLKDLLHLQKSAQITKLMKQLAINCNKQ